MQLGDERPACPTEPVPLRLQLLGAFRAYRAQTPILLPMSTARLVAALALGDTVERRELAARLWPDSSQSRASSDLRTTLWRLQKIEAQLVTSTRQVISLAAGVEVDARRVESWALATIGTPPDPALPVPRPPVTTIRTLLPAYDDEWLDHPRERLRLLQVQAFETTAARLLSAGSASEALPYLLQAVQFDPLRESANQLLIETHLRQGNVAEALRQFRRYRSRLAELGVSPGLAVTTLVARYLPARTAAERLAGSEPGRVRAR